MRHRVRHALDDAGGLRRRYRRRTRGGETLSAEEAAANALKHRGAYEKSHGLELDAMDSRLAELAKTTGTRRELVLAAWGIPSVMWNRLDWTSDPPVSDERAAKIQDELEYGKHPWSFPWMTIQRVGRWWLRKDNPAEFDRLTRVGQAMPEPILGPTRAVIGYKPAADRLAVGSDDLRRQLAASYPYYYDPDIFPDPRMGEAITRAQMTKQKSDEEERWAAQQAAQLESDMAPVNFVKSFAKYMPYVGQATDTLMRATDTAFGVPTSY